MRMYANVCVTCFLATFFYYFFSFFKVCEQFLLCYFICECVWTKSSDRLTWNGEFGSWHSPIVTFERPLIDIVSVGNDNSIRWWRLVLVVAINCDEHAKMKSVYSNVQMLIHTNTHGWLRCLLTYSSRTQETVRMNSLSGLTHTHTH